MITLQPSLTSLGAFVADSALQQIATQLNHVLTALAPSRRTQAAFAKKRDDFNLACYKIRLLLQYLKSTPHSDDPCKLLTGLVDITEMALLTYSVQFHPTGNVPWDPARGQSYWTISELFHELDGYVETHGDYALQLRMAGLGGALHCNVVPTASPTTTSSVPSPNESACLPTSAPMISALASTDYYSRSELEFWPLQLDSMDSEMSKSITTLFPDDFASDLFTSAISPFESTVEESLEFFQHLYEGQPLQSASFTAPLSISDFTSLPNCESAASVDLWDDLLACNLPIPGLLSTSSSSSISTPSDSIRSLSLPSSSPSPIGWTTDPRAALSSQPKRKRPAPAPQGQRTRKPKGESKSGDKPARKRQRKDLKLKWLPLHAVSDGKA